MNDLKNQYIVRNLPQYEQALRQYDCTPDDCRYILNDLILNELPEHYFEDPGYGILADNILENFSPMFFSIIFERLSLRSATFKSILDPGLFEILDSNYKNINDLSLINLTYSLDKNESYPPKVHEYLSLVIKDFDHGTERAEEFRNKNLTAVTEEFEKSILTRKEAVFEELYKYVLQNEIRENRSSLESFQEALKDLKVDENIKLMGRFTYSCSILLNQFGNTIMLKGFLSGIWTAMCSARKSAMGFCDIKFGQKPVRALDGQVFVHEKVYRLENPDAFKIAAFLVDRFREGDDSYYSIGAAFGFKLEKNIGEIFSSNEAIAFWKECLILNKKNGRKWRFNSDRT